MSRIQTFQILDAVWHKDQKQLKNVFTGSYLQSLYGVLL